MKIYEYGEYPDIPEFIYISPGSTRRTWIVYNALPNGMLFNEYSLEETSLYSYKVISDNCISIKNTGEEILKIPFIRRFKK